jgi:superfamily II DNA or RNA helicase
MNKKAKKQAAIVDIYFTANLERCTIISGTGTGKSKIAMDIIQRRDPPKVLILVNSTDLRDVDWKNEFYKWGMQDYYDENVLMETYQSAYKWKKDKIDLTDYLVIADEVDFAANVPELSKFFYEFTDIPIIGLTGFITADKKDWFNQDLPIIDEFTANQAQELGILNNLHYIFVKYDLSKNPKDIKIEYTKHGQKKSFTQSENSAYTYQQEKFVSLIIAKEINNNRFLKSELTYEQYLREIDSIEYRIKMVVKERSDLLLNSVASAKMATKLIKYLTRTTPNQKIVVFSKRTSQSLKICGEDNTYNGVIAKKKALKNYEAFKSGESHLLGVCDKINRGVNIDDLRVAILESFYGSDTQATQRCGRMMRLKPNEVATIFVFLPYYLRKVKQKPDEHGIYPPDKYVVAETQQVTWARKMLRSTTIKTKEVWDYRSLKT